MNMKSTAQSLDPWLLQHLVCPRHHHSLRLEEGLLICPDGCHYPIVEGVPVMLVDTEAQTIALANASIRLSLQQTSPDSLYLDSLGVSGQEREEIQALAATGESEIDPVVSFLIGATNGIAYKQLTGRLSSYPIPELRLPQGRGATLLDVGCSWGRWSIAADDKGYRAIGIDPSLGAILAAKRTSKALRGNALFIVGDARFLPLKSGFVDQVFSYSVLQHFSSADASKAVEEIGRVLSPGGSSLVQMPSKFGLRCIYNQARRHFRDGTGFEVRYWTIPSLRRLFGEKIGNTVISVDCFFGLGLQYSDRHLFSRPLRLVTELSEFLRKLSTTLPALTYGADSIYLESKKLRKS